MYIMWYESICMWYVYVYTESLPRPGNVSWQRRGPGTRGTPTSTSNRLACVMIFLKNIYIYIHLFFVFSLRASQASCETRTRRVRSAWYTSRRARYNRDSVGGKHVRDAYPTSYLLILICVTDLSIHLPT